MCKGTHARQLTIDAKNGATVLMASQRSSVAASSASQSSCTGSEHTSDGGAGGLGRVGLSRRGTASYRHQTNQPNERLTDPPQSSFWPMPAGKIIEFCVSGEEVRSVLIGQQSQSWRGSTLGGVAAERRTRYNAAFR